MEITKDMLIKEIKVLQKASLLHAKYSISQYKKVLKTLKELEEEKKLLEEKVKERTIHLEKEIKQKETLAKQLEKIAKFDILTGLANRYTFLNELKILQEESKLLNKSFTILFIDLDGFKLINDTYGHEIGDKLLQIIAQRIKSSVREEDIVSRLGGDEFTVILKNLKNRQVIEKITKEIINEIKKPIYIDNLTVFVGSSIGIYTYSPDDSTQDILSKADIAMYEAKNKGKGIYTFFDKSMQEKLTKLTILKNNIKKALQNKSFINHFQPIISSVSKKIVGVETLLRLKQGNSLILPTEFIPILEEDINLIKEVTFWQIKSVIQKLKNKNIFYSINLSAKLLNDEDILNYLSNLKTKIKFDPSKLYFEVTETALSENLYKASDILRKIKKMEFNLSLDDFGTGYSSLAYLRELPFETLKIDKQFIDNIVKSKKDQKLLKSIISMAEIMDMKIILEGIETKEQLKIVPSKKIIKYQGYYFYKPMPYIKLSSFI